MDFTSGPAGKESACNAGDLGLIPGLGRSPRGGKGHPLQYSGLENSMGCIIHGIAKSWTWLSDFHFTSYIYVYIYIHIQYSGKESYSAKLRRTCFMNFHKKWLPIIFQEEKQRYVQGWVESLLGLLSNAGAVVGLPVEFLKSATFLPTCLLLGSGHPFELTKVKLGATQKNHLKHIC